MMGRDVFYKQSSWEDMGQAIGRVSSWGGTLDQMRRADQAFQQIRDAIDSLDEDHRISFSYKSLSGALDKLGNDYQKLYTFTGEVGDAVNRHIDHPFYTEIDAFVSAMAQLSISQFHTKNTLNVTEMQATSPMANVATYEKVTKKDLTLDDLFNTSSLMKASLRSEYENFKAKSTSGQAEKVTFDQYKEAIQYNDSFDYKSIKDKQIDKEFWVNLGIGAAIVVLTIARPPAGAVAGVAYGAMQMSDAVTGKSWISGRELSTGERVSSAAFGALDAIPGAEAAGAFGTIGRASMRSAEKVTDLTKTLGQASKGRLVQLRQISRAGITRVKQAGVDLGDRISLGGLQPEFAGVPGGGRGEGFIQNAKNTFRQMASKNIGSVSNDERVKVSSEAAGKISVGKNELDVLRKKWNVPETDTIAVGKTDVKGLEGMTFEGGSPKVRKEAGLLDLDEIMPNRAIKAPAKNPLFTRHAEEGVANEFDNAVTRAGINPNDVTGTLNIHQSNTSGVCKRCIQGLANDNVKPGVLKQLSLKYPNLTIKITSEIDESTKVTGRLSFIIKNGKYID